MVFKQRNRFTGITRKYTDNYLVPPPLSTERCGPVIERLIVVSRKDKSTFDKIVKSALRSLKSKEITRIEALARVNNFLSTIEVSAAIRNDKYFDFFSKGQQVKIVSDDVLTKGLK